MLIIFALLQSGQNLIVLTLKLIPLFPHIIICKASISPMYSNNDVIVHNLEPYFIYKFAEHADLHM